MGQGHPGEDPAPPELERPGGGQRQPFCLRGMRGDMVRGDCIH